VDESHQEACNYDMIIGRDIMHSLGINLLFDTAEISCGNAKVHMQHPEILRGNWVETLEEELLFAHHLYPNQECPWCLRNVSFGSKIL
jgi:hypothetical protein